MSTWHVIKKGYYCSNMKIKSISEIPASLKEALVKQEKSVAIKAAATTSANHLRDEADRGTFAVVVTAKQEEGLTPKGAEALSHLAAVHRILRSIGAEDQVKLPSLPEGYSLPEGRNIDLRNEVPLEPTLTRQEELLRLCANPVETQVVMESVELVLPRAGNSVLVEKHQDGGFSLKNKEELKRFFWFLVSASPKGRVPRMSDMHTSGALRMVAELPGVYLGEEGEKWVVVAQTTTTTTWLEPRTMDGKWDNTRLMESRVKMTEGDQSPKVVTRLQTHHLRGPEGETPAKGMALMEGFATLAKAPAAPKDLRKLGRILGDFPASWGLPSKGVRQFVEVATGLVSHGNEADIPVSAFLGMLDKFSELHRDVEKTSPFWEGYDQLHLALQAERELQGNIRPSRWVKAFLRHLVGVEGDRLRKEDRLFLSEHTGEREICTHWICLMVHGDCEMPGWREETTPWLKLLTGQWPSLRQVPTVDPYRYGGQEIDLILSKVETSQEVETEEAPVEEAPVEEEIDIDIEEALSDSEGDVEVIVHDEVSVEVSDEVSDENPEVEVEPEPEMVVQATGDGEATSALIEGAEPVQEPKTYPATMEGKVEELMDLGVEVVTAETLVLSGVMADALLGGMSAEDIAEATGMSTEQVNTLRSKLAQPA